MVPGCVLCVQQLTPLRFFKSSHLLRFTYLSKAITLFSIGEIIIACIL